MMRMRRKMMTRMRTPRKKKMRKTRRWYVWESVMVGVLHQVWRFDVI
jgi:hypothetical protein